MSEHEDLLSFNSSSYLLNIDVITTIDELNKVIDKLDNAKSSTDVNVLVSGIEDAVDDLKTFRDDKQKELDEFERYYSPNNKSMPSENIVIPVADPINN